MMLSDIGEVIAVRSLSYKDDQNNAHEVIISIGKPAQFPDSNDFFTPYQITGVGSEKVRCAGGIDPIQSLQLVMRMIGYELSAIRDALEFKLIWEGDESGDLGFPLPENERSNP